MSWKKLLRKASLGVIIIFALVGFGLSAGFFAVKYHLTDSLGKIDINDRYFAEASRFSAGSTTAAGSLAGRELEDQCRLWVLSQFMPDVAKNIADAYRQLPSDEVLKKMLAAQEIYLRNNALYQEKVKGCSESGGLPLPGADTWMYSGEWQTLREAIKKDTALINEVGYKTDTEPRMIVAMLVGEQLRLFNSDREIYKQFFQPLKILGNETKFSLGVTGVKEETAIALESHLKDKTSPFYLGTKYENLLNFSSASVAEERFNRLTDEHNRYYPYLYAALFVKQIEKQWKDKGYDIAGRPEILATIYNLGFAKSLPNANPQVGGSTFAVGGREYTFGSIAHQFYYSGELFAEFPILEK